MKLPVAIIGLFLWTISSIASAFPQSHDDMVSTICQGYGQLTLKIISKKESGMTRAAIVDELIQGNGKIPPAPADMVPSIMKLVDLVFIVPVKNHNEKLGMVDAVYDICMMQDGYVAFPKQKIKVKEKEPQENIINGVIVCGPNRDRDLKHDCMSI